MARLGRGYPNTALPRRPPTVPVVFDALGAGLKTTSASGSYAHVNAGSVVLASVFTVGTAPAVTFGGTSMPQLASVTGITTGSKTSNLFVFGLMRPATGSQTMAASGLSTNSSVNTVSYLNAAGLGTAVAVGASTSSTVSMTVAALPGQMVFQTFGDCGSGYNQTLRWNAYASGIAWWCDVGDAPGASTITFTDTLQSSQWGGIAVPIIAA